MTGDRAVSPRRRAGRHPGRWGRSQRVIGRGAGSSSRLSSTASIPPVDPKRPALGAVDAVMVDPADEPVQRVRPAHQGGPAGGSLHLPPNHLYRRRTGGRCPCLPRGAVQAWATPFRMHLDDTEGSGPAHRRQRVAAPRRALPVAPSDTHEAAPRAGPHGRFAPDHVPQDPIPGLSAHHGRQPGPAPATACSARLRSRPPPAESDEIKSRHTLCIQGCAIRCDE